LGFEFEVPHPAVVRGWGFDFRPRKPVSPEIDSTANKRCFWTGRVDHEESTATTAAV